MSPQIFLCQDLQKLKNERNSIIKNVQENGYALIRGLYHAEEIRQKLSKVFEYSNQHSHRASQGVAPEDIRKNISKWSIGGTSTSQTGIFRFMLTIYNPLFEQDIFGLHPIFKKLIAIRDTLGDRNLLSDDVLLPTHFNACRIQVYPAGGGFMSAHVDSRAVTNFHELKEDSKTYIQLVLLLTQKGLDYTSGGAFVKTDSGLVDSEANSLSGDILVYDGATNHGVSDIDPQLSFEEKNLRGRAVALATIYNKT
ncbi:MAG: hypothetical protein K0S29_346 [Gammaproteobacteria bacterium]|jgi:hypothetical protein|nr:hypothetical protein [Gammaproteobacteria bacterium]